MRVLRCVEGKVQRGCRRGAHRGMSQAGRQGRVGCHAAGGIVLQVRKRAEGRVISRSRSVGDGLCAEVWWGTRGRLLEP